MISHLFVTMQRSRCMVITRSFTLTGEMTSKWLQKLFGKAFCKVAKWLKDSCCTLNRKKWATLEVKGQIPGFNFGLLFSMFLKKKNTKNMRKTLKYSIVDSKYTWNSLTAEESTTFLHAMIVSHLHYCISCWFQTILKSFWLEISRFLSLNILSKYNIVSLENPILFSDLRVHEWIHNLNKERTFFLAPLWANEQNLPILTSHCSELPSLSLSFHLLPSNTRIMLRAEHKTGTDNQTFSHGVNKWTLSDQSCQHKPHHDPDFTNYHFIVVPLISVLVSRCAFASVYCHVFSVYEKCF